MFNVHIKDVNINKSVNFDYVSVALVRINNIILKKVSN